MILGWPLDAWAGFLFICLFVIVGVRVAITTPSRGTSVRPPKRKWK